MQVPAYRLINVNFLLQRYIYLNHSSTNTTSTATTTITPTPTKLNDIDDDTTLNLFYPMRKQSLSHYSFNDYSSKQIPCYAST